MTIAVTLCTFVVAFWSVSGHGLAAQQLPPLSEAEALRMLASDDFRERDAAMYFVYRLGKAGQQVSPALRDALIREARSENWDRGRPAIESYDEWGEVWSDYRSAIASLRDPAVSATLLRMGCCADELAAMGRDALLATIVALEDTTSDEYTVGVALRALAIVVYDGVPTTAELERIAVATERRLMDGNIMDAPDAIALAVLLRVPRLTGIVQRIAEDRTAAAALAGSDGMFAEMVQASAKEALQPDFVPRAVRNRKPLLMG